MSPPAPVQTEVPGQLPTPTTSLVQAAPPPTPSSMRKLQLSSSPLHTSGTALSRVHPVQPTSGGQSSRPWQVPTASPFEQVRMSPSVSSLQSQPPVSGMQKSPACSPLGSSPQV